MGNQNFQPIEYPLNNSNNLIKEDKINCNNPKIADHSNIEIIYDKESEIPTLYRCPVCLCIPLLYYQKLEIIYKCNCGIYKCSLDYFFTNFKSYPIININFKDNLENKEEIAFCSSCVKFINNVNKHKEEYFGHIIRNTNFIFFKSKEGNYTEYIFECNYCEGINQISKKYKKYAGENRKINFRYFISKYLNFNLIGRIEKLYKEFQKEFIKGKEKLKKENKYDKNKIKISEEMNTKLYLFSKFIYFVFEKNYKKNNLNFQIIFNIFFIVYNRSTTKKQIIDIFEHYFIEDFSCNPKFNNKNYKEIKYLSSEFILERRLGYEKIYYDKSLKRFIILDGLGIYITLKNELYDIIYKTRFTWGQGIIYLEKSKKNILAIKRSK